MCSIQAQLGVSAYMSLLMEDMSAGIQWSSVPMTHDVHKSIVTKERIALVGKGILPYLVSAE